MDGHRLQHSKLLVSGQSQNAVVSVKALSGVCVVFVQAGRSNGNSAVLGINS